MARFVAAQICASVLGDVRVLTNRRFVEGLDINRLNFDPEEIREKYLACESSAEEYPWTLDPHVLRRLIEGQDVGDDEAGIDLAVCDLLEQRAHVALDVGLAGLDGQGAVHDRAKRDLVEESAVDRSTSLE